MCQKFTEFLMRTCVPSAKMLLIFATYIEIESSVLVSKLPDTYFINYRLYLRGWQNRSCYRGGYYPLRRGRIF